MTEPPRKILVRGPNWVGDVVMATPALRALRRRYPSAAIFVSLKPYVVPVLEGWDAIDGIIPREGGGGPIAAWRHGRSLRRHGFDFALLLTNSFSTALEVFAARVPRRRGYVGDGRAWLLTERIRPQRDGRRRRPRPMADFYLALVEDLVGTEASRAYELPVTPAAEEAARAWLVRHDIEPAAGRGVVGINPGARFGSSKLWRPDRFAAVADRLSREHGVRIVLLGGPGEEELLASIAAAMEEPCIDSGRDILPLGVLGAVIRRLALLVTTDTGPRAMAQAFGIPCVVVMGPTDPRWTDINNDRSVIIRHDVPCGPCHKKVCDLDHRCMELIEVDAVATAAARLLAESARL